MIAAFVLYAFVLSAVIGALAMLAHRVAALRRRPMRFGWMAAMLLMVLAPIVASLWPSGASESMPTTSVASVSALRAAPVPADLHDTASRYVGRSWWRDLPQAFEELLATTVERAQPFDAVLGAIWGLASLTLLLVAGRAAHALRRMRTTLTTREVDGTTIHVSPQVGPAALGGATPTIIVPEWALSLDHELLRLVLTHEREHLAARDPALLRAGLALLIAMPWLPPLWWCWHRLRLAIELDCDARVLRAYPSPRAYAQLLLFVSQRRAAPTAPWPLLSSPTLAFNPQVNHLKRRIDAMTVGTSAHSLRLAIFIITLVGTATVAVAIPAPTIVVTTSVRTARAKDEAAASAPQRAPDASPVIVSITRTALTFATPSPSTGSPLEIVLYGDGPVRVGFGTQPRALVGDTIVLSALPAFTVDVSQGDLHVELRRGARLVELGGEVQGGPAQSVRATGRHLVLNKGGTGIRILQREGNDLSNAPTSGARTVLRRATAPVPVTDMILADSVAARKSSLELRRLTLLAKYEPWSPLVQEVTAGLNAVDAVLATLSPRARARAMAEVLLMLDRREAGLTVEIEQLQAKYESSSPMVTTSRKERDLLGARRQELRPRR